MPEPPATPFITREGPLLKEGDVPYRFVGMNYWQGVTLALEEPPGDRPRLHRELDQLAALGLRNLRILAVSEGPDEEPYRISPALYPARGQPRKAVLDALDYLLWQLARRDIRAVLCLGNFWFWSGGFAQHLAWQQGVDIPYPVRTGNWAAFARFATRFYEDAGARNTYFAHAEAVVSRRNRYAGRAYRDDPTIMAWQLANEPRGGHVRESFLDWAREGVQRLRAWAPAQLVSLGTEGSTYMPAAAGLDFVEDAATVDVDYATLHLWPENWGHYNPRGSSSSFHVSLREALRHLERHGELAQSVGKPLVLEEVGLARDGGDPDPGAPVSRRDAFFRAIVDTVAQEPIYAGINAWCFAGEGHPDRPGQVPEKDDPLTGDPPHEPQGWYSIYDTDRSTLDVLARGAREMTTT